MMETNKKSDEELLKDLKICDPQGIEVELIRMTLFVRKIDHLAGAITEASKSGRILSWMIGIATIVGTVIAALQYFK